MTDFTYAELFAGAGGLSMGLETAGWPDGHTAYGVAEDGTRYALSDTARYRLCGNGVASPVAAWIGFRLRWALEGYDHP